jgi:hypothetical protein
LAKIRSAVHFGALTEQEIDELLLKAGDVYVRKTPVVAVVLTKRVTIEQRDRSIVTTRPGDYLVRNIEGDKRPWILPQEYFESNFEKYRDPEDKSDRAEQSKTKKNR